MKRWLIGCMVVLIIGLTACQPAFMRETQKSVNSEGTQSKTFYPYQGSKVPNLQSLVEKEGFLSYTKGRPYVLGSSYDGAYIAVIVYEKQAGMYRVSIHHTGKNIVEEILYVPTAKTLRESSRPEEAKEQLKLSQEALSLGYRIKVPVKPMEAKMGEAIQLSEKSSQEKELRYYQQGEQLFLETRENNKYWVIWQTVLEKEEEIGNRWLLFQGETIGKKWITVAWTFHEGSISPLVHTANLETLKDSWTTSSLSNRITRTFGKEATIIYRGELSAEGPDSLIVVREEEAVALSRVPWMYRSKVSHFVIFDQEGKVRFRGSPLGLKKDEGQVIDPSLSTNQQWSYRLFFTRKEGKVEEEQRTLVVDQLDEQRKIARTYELVWNPEKRQFQLLSDRKEVLQH